MASEAITYDRSELRGIIRAFKAMDEQAVDAAKRESNALAEFLAQKIREKATTRTFANAGVMRVAEGGKVSKTSKIGEISYGFASQKFSGGGDTKTLWAGYEFGSKKYPQFPTFSGRYGRGSKGYFIYPTLRENQSELVRQWEEAFSKILKEWD
jgi:hypothetical protein